MPNDQRNPTKENLFERACFTFFGREKADLISAAGGAALGGYTGFLSNMYIDYTFLPCKNSGCDEANRLIWVAAGFGLLLTGAITGAFSFNLASRGIREIFKCLTGYQKIPAIEEDTNPSPQLNK
jgi:hypothetical protein